MAKIIEETVIEMPLPVELATVGSVFRSRLRAQLEEWKAAHPELSDVSPAVAVVLATVSPKRIRIPKRKRPRKGKAKRPAPKRKPTPKQKRRKR